MLRCPTNAPWIPEWARKELVKSVRSFVFCLVSTTNEPGFIYIAALRRVDAFDLAYIDSAQIAVAKRRGLFHQGASAAPTIEEDLLTLALLLVATRFDPRRVLRSNQERNNP